METEAINAAAETEAKIAERRAVGDLTGAATIGLRFYGREILGFLLGVLKNEADANDAFASFGEHLWRGIAEFRFDASFKTWAYKLAWHAALRQLRDPYRKRGQALATSDVEALVAEVRASTAAYLKTEAKDALAEIRATLEPEEQTLLVLRLDRDLSWSEIAIVLGGETNETALRKRFERLKEKVRREAAARGLLKPE